MFTLSTKKKKKKRLANSETQTFVDFISFSSRYMFVYHFLWQFFFLIHILCQTFSRLFLKKKKRLANSETQTFASHFATKN